MADEDNPRNGYRVVEWFRFVTPVLVTVAITMVGGLRSDIKDIDNKLFTHLTNDEIHAPRSTIVTKAEFDLAYEVRERQFQGLTKTMEDLRIDLKELIREMRK